MNGGEDDEELNGHFEDAAEENAAQRVTKDDEWPDPHVADVGP